MELSIIPKDFPMPKDPKQRENGCRNVREEVPEEEVPTKSGETGVNENTVTVPQSW